MNEEKSFSSEALDQLVEEMGIGSLPEDKKNDILSKMTEVLLKRIFIETMDKLGDQGRDEYEEIIQRNPNSEELEGFFAERIKNYDELIQTIITDFKNEMLSADKNNTD